MPDDKIKISNATWEYFGGTTPIPDFNDLLTKNIKGEGWLNPEKKPVTLEEKFGNIPTTIKGFQDPENSFFDISGDIKNIRDTKRSDQTFTQKASIDVENALLSANLHNTGIGDATRELLTPIQSGGLRMQEGISQLLYGNIPQKAEGLGNTALGLAGGTFGTLMSPFSAIRMGAEQVGGETAGKVAEVSSLALAGGLPLIAGYIVSNGVGAVTEEVTKALGLDPKDSETAQEVMGILSFVAGTKGAEKFGRKINTELGKKVVKWLDESIPEKMGDSVFRKGEGEAVPTGTYKDLLKGQDQQRVINNPPEKRAYQEPTEILPQVELVKDTPSALVFNEQQIRQRISEIDNEVRKAESEGNETLYNELQTEKKRWQDQLPEIKDEVVETPEIIKPTEEPISKREKQKQTLYDENKAVINKILDENKGLLTEREISSKLNNLIDEGKLKKKVSPESIKKIKQEWKDAQPKPEKQVIKATPNELGLKIPNELNDNTIFHYGKNAPVKLKDYVNEHPEVIEKIKDLNTFEEVSDVLRKDWNERSANVLNKKDINAPAKDLLEKTTKEEKIPDSVWDEVFGKPQTREQILKDLEQAKREGLNNVGSILGAINTDVIKGYAKLGALNIKEGAKSFDAWSKKMIEDVGDEIRPYLRELYAGIKQNAKIDDKPILEYIEKNKDLFNLDLNKIEGKIVDPNSNLEGAARHKAGRNKSTIEFNDNTQGETWYHEFAHVVNNKIRQVQPDFLNEFRPEIDKLVPESVNKPLNEKFADAFVEMYTNPNAPRTRLFNLIQNTYKIPTSFELARRTNKELGFEKLPEREAGVREEKSLEWLEQKYDAPKEVINEVENARDTDLYKELRDDGTQTFQEALKESARLQDITEAKLLDLDPMTLNGKVFNKAQQVKIDQIAVNKALQVGELRKTFGEKLSSSQAKQLETEMLNLVKLQALAKNNLREAARVMESARRKNALSPEEYEMVQKVANEIDIANKNSNLSQKVKRIEELTDPTLKDKIQYGWYSLALSNPLTDAANIGGNISSLASVLITHPLSGMKAFKRAYIDGLAFQNAYKILKGEQHTISKYTEQSATKREVINPKSKWGNILKGTVLPVERLRVEDALFRTFFEELAKEKTAKIRAKELGVDKKEILKVYDDLITKKSSVDKLVSEWGDEKFIKDVEGVERWASKMVFQENLGEVGRTVQKGLNLVFPLNLLTIPFLRIAVNMGKLGLEASPYGLAKLGARKIKQHFGKDVKEMTDFERKDLFQRAVMGTAFYSALTAILQDSSIEITGDAPKDKNIRDLWSKAGYQENSFIINNKDGSKTNVSFNNITPFNVILGGIGTLMTKAKFDKKDDKGVGADALDIVLGMANALGNQSFLQRSSQLLDILNAGDGVKLETFLYQAIPAPSILSLRKGSTDLEALGIGEAPTIYETKTLGEVVQNRYGVTEGLTPKAGVFGEDRKSTYQRFPFPTKRQSDKIANFMLEKKLVIDDPNKPTEGNKEIFTDEEFNRYNKLYRRNFYSLMNQHYGTLQEMEKNESYGQMMVEKFVSQIKEQARELAKQSVKEKK